MSIELLITALVPIIVGLGMIVLRHLYSRLAELDKRVRCSMDEAAVRRLVNDKIDPIRDDIREIKDKLDKMIDLYLTKR